MVGSVDILERLVAFPTVSRDSNLALMDYVRTILSSCGISGRLVHNEDGTKANLFAFVGPSDRPGVLLSGHTDVVPAEGQDWSCDPFALTRAGDLLYGRGAADMKAFVACALRAACAATSRQLRSPLWLAFSYDEELGCIGVRRLIDVMAAESLVPACCIVGEPTSMDIATGHKGKTALRAECRGRAAHSAFAPNAVNALHLACDFVGCLREAQADLAGRGSSDSGYAIPYTTIHAARITGGLAANIVPDRCTVEFEIRNIQADDPEGMIGSLRASAERICTTARRTAPESGIKINVANSYPGLDTPPDAEVVGLVRSLIGGAGTMLQVTRPVGP